MTLFKATDGVVVGQPISPNFGAQNGGQGAGNVTVQLPSGMPLLVAASLGLVPANALVSTVNGINVGQGDAATVAELLGSGNGAPSMQGTPTTPSGAINDQQFVRGITTNNAALSNGPTSFNTEPQVFAPVSGATLGANVGLTANGFSG